ncbi:MAG: hypothetical protein DRQ88_13250 [Epsilonproteobacteria bacterium]|nr:MAG: hypothetical protein DRQ88_13250 [Campylobacterota bacterium]RLA64201.1 MAG: hypothetical protein DRQ89_04385 [Campylobacterota bacterium]
MKKIFLLISFCLVCSPLSYGESFSWSKYVPKEGRLKPKPSRINHRKRDLKKRPLYAVDPNSFRFKDHRRKKELTVLIFGDSGRGESDQYLVGRMMYEKCKEERCDFALLLGDIIYPSGISHTKKGEMLSRKDMYQINKKFELPYKDFHSFDFWMIPGNHDWYGDVQHAINYTQKSVRWKMPYNHYEIPWLPKWIRMYGLDTTRIERLDHKSGLVKEQMETANKKYLAKTGLVDEQGRNFCSSKGWKILFGHHGIYTSGRHGKLDMVNIFRNLNPRRVKGVNKYMRQKLYPFIKYCGVQILAAGHDHHQEHIKAIDPKTGKMVFHQILQGAAATSRKTEKVNHPEYKSLVTSSMLGFSILTFTPDKVHVKYFGYPKDHPEEFKMYYETNIYKKDFK